MTLQLPLFHQWHNRSQNVTRSVFSPHLTPHTSVRRRRVWSIVSQPGCPCRYYQHLGHSRPIFWMSELWEKVWWNRHMTCHLLRRTHGLSLTALDTLSVTYWDGHMACHLLPWTHCRSLTGMDTWPVTYCTGHMACHILPWTHGRSLTALDSWPTTYCARHIAVT